VAKAFGGLGVIAGLAADRTSMSGMVAGQEFFETDTKKMFVYNGSVWVQENDYTLGAMVVDASGRVRLPYQPAFKAHSTNNSVANNAKWPLPVASLNVGGHFNTSTWLFTVPVSGVYIFGGMIRLDANLSYVHFQSQINGVTSNENGDLPGLTGFGTSANGFTANSFSYMRYLTAGTTFNFIINNNAGGTYNAHAQSHCFGYLLG
jgi:hypothetical protein